MRPASKRRDRPRARPRSRAAQTSSRWPVEQDPRARLRPGHDLLRRHRSRLRRRLPERRASAVLQAGPDAARRRRVGLDRRLGLGTEPGAGLPGDRQGRRRQARGRDGPFAARQDGALGRRPGRALRPGDLERLGLRRGGAQHGGCFGETVRAHQHGLSALVLRQLQAVQRPRERPARSTSTC